MRDLNDRLRRFKEVLQRYPNISANDYDKLVYEGKPGRRALEDSSGKRWSELLVWADVVRDKPDLGSSSEIIDEEGIKEEYSDDRGFVQVTSRVIKTLDEALEDAKVDLGRWVVDHWVRNSWGTSMKVHDDVTDRETGMVLKKEKVRVVTNYQVKVWLKPKIEEPLEKVIKGLIRDIPKLEIPKFFISKPKKSGYALEMDLFDAHIGKLAWGRETMQGDQDTKIAARKFEAAGEKLLNYSSSFPIEKIFFIIGQDYLHVENYLSQTPIGRNVLDADGRLPKIYLEAKKALLKVLYLCRQVAPVECLWVPGNHDMHVSFYLSDVVKEHFMHDKHMTVDNDANWNKARLWGNLLVGYTHDASTRTVNIVNMLPQFWPDLWGKSKFREWHTGHKHKKDELKYKPTQTVGGVVIRQIPALSTIDAWHYQHNFVDAVPGGESFIWSKENGICAHFTAYVKY